jgi:hypothetical protein
MECEQLRLLVEQLRAMLWTTDEQLTITAIGGVASNAVGRPSFGTYAAPVRNVQATWSGYTTNPDTLRFILLRVSTSGRT